MLSPARTWTKPRTQCPYCAHVSPDDSKFCNECGAALHLAPCPHCGAVNDLSLMDVCARCHGDLQADAAPASEAAAPAPDEALDDPLPPLPTLVLPAPRPKAKPWPLLLAGLVLMAGASTAGYLVYQQRGAASAQSIAIIDAAVRDALDAQPIAPSASMPARPAATPARPIEVTATAFEPEPAAKPSPAPATPAPEPRRAAKPPSARPAAEAPRSAVEPPPPKIGPCTDAVAALGLCRSGSTDTPTRSP